MGESVPPVQKLSLALEDSALGLVASQRSQILQSLQASSQGLQKGGVGMYGFFNFTVVLVSAVSGRDHDNVIFTLLIS